MYMEQAQGDEGGAGSAGGGTGGAVTIPGGGAAAAPVQGQQTVTTPEAQPFDWKSLGMDDAQMAIVNNRAWKSPKDMLTSYRNLESFTGVPPDQIVKLPKEMTPEAMAPVWDKLGRPKTPEEYKLTVPEGADATYMNEMAKVMHANGASSLLAQNLAKAHNEYFESVVKKQTEEYTAKTKAEEEAIKKEWGDRFENNVNIARKAAQQFGMNAEQITALEKAMGFAGTHKFLHEIGKKLGEAEFVQSGGTAQEFSGMTPETAAGMVQSLVKNKDFQARFNHSDPQIRAAARAELKRYEDQMLTG